MGINVHTLYICRYIQNRSYWRNIRGVNANSVIFCITRIHKHILHTKTCRYSLRQGRIVELERLNIADLLNRIPDMILQQLNNLSCELWKETFYVYLFIDRLGNVSFVWISVESTRRYSMATRWSRARWRIIRFLLVIIPVPSSKMNVSPFWPANVVICCAGVE
jgi:hypothetical protein